MMLAVRSHVLVGPEIHRPVYKEGGQWQKEVPVAENLLTLNDQTLPMLSQSFAATISHLSHCQGHSAEFILATLMGCHVISSFHP